MRHAIIRDGIVENVIEWDGKSDWPYPEGTTVEPFPEGGIALGWPWNSGSPADPNPPPPPPPPVVRTDEEKVEQAVGITVEKLKALLAEK